MRNVRRLLLPTICCVAISATVALAEDTPDVAALKAEKAREDAAADLLKSQLTRLQNQRALEAAQADAESAAIKAKADAQTALANQHKAEAEANKAQAEAEVAAVKAKFGGSVPGTTLGSTTTDSGAGALEASLLAAASIDRAAQSISEDLQTLAAGKTIVIFTGTGKPSFGDLRVFELKREIILQAYQRADAAKKEADTAADALPPLGQRTQIAPGGGLAIGGAVTAAGAILEGVSKLGSYFQSDYKAAGLSVAGADADLLAVSLVNRRPGAFYPARWSPPGQAVVDLMAPLPDYRRFAVEDLAEVQISQKAMAKAAADEKDAETKKAREAVAAKYTAVAEAYIAVNKAFDDLLTGLGEPDATGSVRVTRVVEQKAIWTKMEGGALGVILQVAGAGGTSYTKKNLWTFFGDLPFYVSGGAIASYLVVDKTGAVLGAAQMPLHSPYMRVVNVDKHLRAQPKKVESTATTTRRPEGATNGLPAGR